MCISGRLVFVLLLLAGGVAGQTEVDDDFPYVVRGVVGGEILLEEIATGKVVRRRVGEAIGGYTITGRDVGGLTLERDGVTLRLGRDRGGEKGAAFDCYPWEVPAWRREMRRPFEETRLQFEFDGVALERVLEKIQEKVGVPISISPRVVLERSGGDLRISVSVGPARAQEVLDVVLAGPDLVSVFLEEGVRVQLRSESRPDHEPERVEEGLRRARAELLARAGRESVEEEQPVERLVEELRRQRVPSSWTGRTFADISGELERRIEGRVVAMSGQTGAWAPLREVRLARELAGMDLETALRVFLSPLGLDHVVVGNTLQIGPTAEVEAHRRREEERMRSMARRRREDEAVLEKSWESSGGTRSIRQTARELHDRLGLGVYPSRVLWNANPTIELPEGVSSVRRTMEALHEQKEVEWIVHDGSLYLFLRVTGRSRDG